MEPIFSAIIYMFVSLGVILLFILVGIVSIFIIAAPYLVAAFLIFLIVNIWQRTH